VSHIARIATSLNQKIRYHGLRAAAYDTLIRLVNKSIYLKSLECLVVERVDPRPWTLPSGFDHVRLDRDRLWSFARVKENQLPEGFVREALARGDECYAVLDGDTLASYGWYSKMPTRIDRDLRIAVSRQYVYMYKAFTSHAYRGQRLHAIGKVLALREYVNQGFKGLLSYVESNNFDSLKSCRRIGARTCGHLRVLRLAGRYFIHTGHGCRDYGFELSLRT